MKENVKNLIKIILFIALTVTMITFLTYLLRNISYSRNNVSGIYNEENIDVVCIGGSSTTVYWKPLYAWNQYGITSYNFSTDAFRAPLMTGAIKEVLKAQDPQLLILDMRSFTYGGEQLSDVEDSIRNMTDSMNYGINRLETVIHVLNYYNEDVFKDNNTSYIFDIAKYHSNTDAFGSKDAWNHILNNTRANYKGFYLVDTEFNQILTEPVDIDTDECIPVEESVEKQLIDVLEYVSTLDIDVLFVQGPLQMDTKRQMRSNYIGKIITSYGYDYLNTNNYYQEMNIDFSKDFYNNGHVNVYGSDKYTNFVGQYIMKHYNITDHSSDINYSSQWDELYDSYLEKEQLIKAEIDEVYELNMQDSSN